MNMGSGDIGMRRSAMPRTYGWVSILCAILSTMFLAEVFGSAAIILGAYQWKNEPDSSFGLIVIIIGIVAMFIGVYFTAYPDLIDLIYMAT